MSVGVEGLFTSALGLVPPWEVDKVELDTARRRIDFEVRCSAKALACPHCGAADQRIHDRLRRSWRHLDFFQFEAWLHADVPRVACAGCAKTSQVGVPWAREGSGFTALFEALALALCRELPVKQAAALLRCADKQLWRRIEHYVEQARALDDMSTVKIVGIDDTSLHKGQSYITVVHDLDAKRLLFATEGRDHQTVVDFAADLLAHGGNPEAVQHVCQDMSAAYAKGVAMVLPNAAISYDRFHVVAMAVDAMDAVRQAEMRDEPQAVAKALGTTERKTIKGLMWGKCQEPRRLVDQADECDALAAAFEPEECAGVAAEDGAARGLCARRGQQRSAGSARRLERLAELGQALPARAVQEAGQDDHRARRGRRAGNDRQPIQRLRRGDERFAAAGQARRTRLPHGDQLHRHRLLAHVQAQAPTGSSLRACHGEMRSLRSTRKGIEPLSGGVRLDL